MDLLEQFKKAIEKILMGYHGTLAVQRRWLLLLVEAPSNHGSPRDSGHLLVQIAYPGVDRPLEDEAEIVLHLAALSIGVSYPFASLALVPGELVLIDLEIGEGVWIVPNAVLYRKAYGAADDPIPGQEEKRDSDQETPRATRQDGDRSVWPEPTTPQPDWETIEEWLWADGGSEATDGCWCEVDGACPHGHPSWLRRLGLI